MAWIDRTQDVWACDFYSRRKLFYPNSSDNFSQGDLNRYAFLNKAEVVLLVFAPSTQDRAPDLAIFGRNERKVEFDFARALVLVAFLSGDLDRGKPGRRSVDEIHTDRG